MLQRIKETVTFLQSKTNFNPQVGIVLGTGLGGLVKEIDVQIELDYEEIPSFPVSTVEGHHGKLIFGILGDKRVMAMQGRFHFYEGYTLEDIVFPIRVMKWMGIENLFLSNASGGVNPDYEIGDLMILEDHINLLPNPLIGKHFPEFGTRFPDMGEVYSKDLINKAEQIAVSKGINVQKGVYTATTGPTYETPAEYKYFRVIGSDAVGMSTVPETIAAHQMGLPCFAISIITDLGVPGKIETITHESVQEVAMKAEEKMTLIMKNLIATL